ncbi:MAG: Gmad2 immunoglobulin-like domain-containing protein [Acidimicrobiales bacterium]
MTHDPGATDPDHKGTPDHTGIPEHTETQERLRAALADRAAHIRPSPDGLDRIEEKLMEERTRTGDGRWIYGAVSAAAVVLLVVVGFFVLGDDDDDAAVVADSSTSTTEESTTTSSTTASTTTEPFAPEVDPFAVAYPSPTTSQRFESPESAGQSYATEVLGFTEIVVGEYRAGDSRSGELPVTDREGGPETTILVRQMEDDTWYVLGSVTEDITVDQPQRGDPISSPFETTGSALAFEGHVSVVVRALDDPTPLGEGFVTGNGVPPAGPFEGSIEFEAPPEEVPGIVIYLEYSAQDGHVRKATSIPVRLSPS